MLKPLPPPGANNPVLPDPGDWLSRFRAKRKALGLSDADTWPSSAGVTPQPLPSGALGTVPLSNLGGMTAQPIGSPAFPPDYLTSFQKQIQMLTGAPADANPSGLGAPVAAQPSPAVPFMIPANGRAVHIAQNLPPGSGVLGGPDSEPPPTLPDFTQNFDDLAAVNRLAAGIRGNQFDVDVAQQNARAAGNEAALKILPGYDPNAAAYHWTPVQPTILGAPQQAPLPQRGVPGHDPISQLLALAAGAVDPRGAGAYNASPLIAASNVVNTKYEDDLRKFQELQAQYNQAAEADRFNAQNQNQFGILNAEQQHSADLAAVNAKTADALHRAPYVQNSTEANALTTPFTEFADREREAAGYGADAQSIQAYINAKEKQTQQQIEIYKATKSPEVRAYIAQLKAQTDLARTQLLVLQKGENSKWQHDDREALIPIKKQTADNGTTNADANAKRADAYSKNVGSQIQDRAFWQKKVQDEAATQGAAAKDPYVRDAFTAAQNAVNNLSSTETILGKAWDDAHKGSMTTDGAARSKFIHTNGTWLDQQKAVETSWQAYQTEKARATPLPGTGGNGSVAPHSTGPGLGTRRPAPGPATPAPGTTYDPRTRTWR